LKASIKMIGAFLMTKIKE